MTGQRADVDSTGRKKNVAVIREHSVTGGKWRKTANFYTVRSPGDGVFGTFFGA